MADVAGKRAELFTNLAPVLNVSDLAAERAFYEALGLPVTYEGSEYPEFIAFTTDTVHFGLQQAPETNDPPSVLTWQIAVSDMRSLEFAYSPCSSGSSSSETELMQ